MVLERGYRHALDAGCGGRVGGKRAHELAHILVRAMSLDVYAVAGVEHPAGYAVGNGLAKDKGTHADSLDNAGDMDEGVGHTCS